MKTISRLHYITTNEKLAEQACKGGVNWIQLRLKETPYHEFLKVALATQTVCKNYGTTLIINDNVDLAKEIGADGVHLGKEDMNPLLARHIFGEDKIIGCTANTRSDIKKLSELPIDYIGLGPFRFTTTKKKLGTLLGINGFTRVINSLKELSIKSVPIIGIGGITQYDIEKISHTGLYGIAVSGAISNADNIELEAGRFKMLTDIHFNSKYTN